MLFGPSDEDTLQILYVSDRWLGSEDATFPSRKALTKTVAEGFYGRTVTGDVAPEKLREQATQGCEWYYDNSGARFRERQRVKEVSKEIAQERYLPGLSGEVHEKTTGRLDSAEANSNAMKMNISQGLADTGAAAISSTATSSVIERHHEGHLLNLGQKFQCLAWEPCDSNSLFQYLAVSCSRTSIQSFSDAPSPAILASNSSPSPPTSSSIQIWAFRTASHSPHSCKTRSNNEAKTRPSPVHRLGAIFNRSFGVQYQRRSVLIQLTKSRYRGKNGLDHLLSSLVTVLPECWTSLCSILLPIRKRSIYTCLLLLSPCRHQVLPFAQLGVRFNIRLDYWHIYRCSEYVQHNRCHGTLCTRAEPSLSHQLGSTLVSAIYNAYPSSHSAIVTSTSRSGTLSLMDLRDLSEEAISSNDVCHSPLHLTYSPLAQTFIAVSRDDGITQLGANSPFMLTCRSIQHFARGTNVARLPGEGPVTALAASRWHPSILLVTANGCVFSTNYLRELIPQAQVTGSSGVFIQKLCEYEWIPANPAANFNEMERVPQHNQQLKGGSSCSIADASLPINHNQRSDLTDDQSIDATVTFRGIARRGRSRFHEGFLAERVGVTKSTLANMGEDFVIKIVFQEQGVTTVHWNPNLSCAGWLAVAWGSALVRLQDVALGT